MTRHTGAVGEREHSREAHGVCLVFDSASTLAPRPSRGARSPLTSSLGWQRACISWAALCTT
jgi:hypothetical protein